MNFISYITWQQNWYLNIATAAAGYMLAKCLTNVFVGSQVWIVGAGCNCPFYSLTFAEIPHKKKKNHLLMIDWIENVDNIFNLKYNNWYYVSCLCLLCYLLNTKCYIRTVCSRSLFNDIMYLSFRYPHAVIAE